MKILLLLENLLEKKLEKAIKKHSYTPIFKNYNIDDSKKHSIKFNNEYDLRKVIRKEVNK